MRHIVIIVGLVVVIFILKSCYKDPPLQQKKKNVETTPYTLSIPEGFPNMDIPASNPMTQEGVKLGRRLYYDPILDQDSLRSCGQTCHFQQQSFTSSGPVLPHINLGYMHTFLWNGKVEGTVEEIMLFEVEEFMQTEMRRLNRHPEYPELFMRPMVSIRFVLNKWRKH